MEDGEEKAFLTDTESAGIESCLKHNKITAGEMQFLVAIFGCFCTLVYEVRKFTAVTL